MKAEIFITIFIVSSYLTYKTLKLIDKRGSNDLMLNVILSIFFFSLYLFIGLLILGTIVRNI